MSDFNVRPSRLLRQKVASAGSVNAAARQFGIEPASLMRFLDGDAGINGSTIAAIIEATGSSYDQLFEHVEEKR